MSDSNTTPSGETWQDEREPARSRGRRRLRAVALATAVVLTIGSGIGAMAYADHRGDVAAENKAAAERREAEEARLAAEREREAAELAERKDAYDDCQSQLDPLVEALNVVDARLNVGLSQDEFSRLVGNASVAYSGIEPSDLAPGPCLNAGAKLENALSSYITVGNKWNDCIVDLYCDIDSIDPMMQRNWASASRQIGAAEGQVEKLDPENPASRAGDQA